MVEIVDIRGGQSSSGEDITSLKQQIIDGLSQPAGQKTLPTMLLYDERGLRLYDKITTDAPEYYLFPAEEQILRDNADDIVRYMHVGNGTNFDHETIVELGAGYVVDHLPNTVPSFPQWILLSFCVCVWKTCRPG
jgi:L-histidine Nalpha-methyltransferase / hercynylcysteine S-oxide synthase